MCSCVQLVALTEKEADEDLERIHDLEVRRDRQRERERGRETDRETETERQTERQRDRETV